jgi:hypothetical protein
MNHANQNSAEYFDTSSAEHTPCRNRMRRRREAQKAQQSSLMFRLVMMVGIVFCVHWFYNNQDPILANIRDNSGRFGMFFSDLVKQSQAENTNEFVASDQAETNNLAKPEA